MKAILSAIGLMVVLPFYCLYLIGRGLSGLFTRKDPPRVARPDRSISPDEAEMYEAIFDDD